MILGKVVRESEVCQGLKVQQGLLKHQQLAASTVAVPHK